jgi:hypothetical protein
MSSCSREIRGELSKRRATSQRPRETARPDPGSRYRGSRTGNRAMMVDWVDRALEPQPLPLPTVFIGLRFALRNGDFTTYLNQHVIARRS